MAAHTSGDDWGLRHVRGYERLGEVETYEEYEARWLEDYPEECSWYKLLVVRSLDCNGSLRYFGVSLGNRTIISASTEDGLLGASGGRYEEAAACRLCTLVLPAVRKAIAVLEAGEYNSQVAASLPYQFRIGVIRRSDLWEADPEVKELDYDGLSNEAVRRFRELVLTGANRVDRVGRMREFTANDFFGACKLGYESIGWDCEGMSPSELYCRYSDGRDEGLTGRGCGLNAGPGIDLDDPDAWDEWFFRRDRGGGHPWEVVPGGNSTHVDLYVKHDRRELEWDLRSAAITEAEFGRRIADAGYYFVVAGTHRQYEVVSFYLALSSAGLPVIVTDADALLARFEGTDWVGVVPHHVPTRYCASLFPDEYGTIIDFTHVYLGEDAWHDRIVWLPEKEARLV